MPTHPRVFKAVVRLIALVSSGAGVRWVWFLTLLFAVWNRCSCQSFPPVPARPLHTLTSLFLLNIPEFCRFSFFFFFVVQPPNALLSFCEAHQLFETHFTTYLLSHPRYCLSHPLLIKFFSCFPRMLFLVTSPPVLYFHWSRQMSHVIVSFLPPAHYRHVCAGPFACAISVFPIPPVNSPFFICVRIERPPPRVPSLYAVFIRLEDLFKLGIPLTLPFFPHSSTLL